MAVVGFDFGTTNSLISAVVGDQVIDIVNPHDGRPFPSVVRYEGARTIVGREAKDSLESAGIGIHGNTVLSPKFLLGEESAHVGGVERSPVDIVSDVITHVKEEAQTSRPGRQVGAVTTAVVTIPVNMKGPRRRALRDAFRRSGIGIVQFVHEPLAALYGYFRSLDEPEAAVREYERRNVLVVDWGGGTLDLTLCRISDGRIIQLRNGGTDEVGGDRFDEAIRDGVIAGYCQQQGFDGPVDVHPDARLQLLHDSEKRKIELSERDSVIVYRPGFFRDPAGDLEYRLTRDDLEAMTRPLVQEGINQVTALLDAAGIGPAQVALCLVTGGMAAMPAVSGRLHELFGPQRVVVPDNSGTLISQGAAWIAHDRNRLRLAKPVEVQMARQSYLTVVQADAEMPSEHEVKSDTFDLYCTDPRDGFAKFELCTPRRPGPHPQRSDPREALTTLSIEVADRSEAFRERLLLNISIDEDLVLTATARSLERKDETTAEIHDLEFSLALPNPTQPAGNDRAPETANEVPHRPGDVTVRANVATERDDTLVPGEFLYSYKPRYFDRRLSPPQGQIEEWLYYEPCGVCGRSWSDLECRCKADLVDGVSS